MIQGSYFNNRRGFGIVQILVAAGVTSLISLGIAQMIQATRISQRRVFLTQTLSEQKTRIEGLIRDQNAFNFTINANSGAPYDQLKSSQSVAEIATSAAVKMVLYDGSGTAVMNFMSRTDAAGPYNGLTEKGTPCTTFFPTAGQGRDDCPISYRIIMSVDCPFMAEVTCIDPQLTIAARVVYNPSNNTNSILNNFRGLVSQTAADTSTAAAKYDVLLKRTASTIARSFKYSSLIPALIGICNGLTSGGGLCTVGGGATTEHPSPRVNGWTREYDPDNLFNNNSAVNASLGDFSFNEVGYYVCSITAYAFATNQFSLALRNAMAGQNSGVATAFAGVGLTATDGSEAQVRLETSLYVPNITDVYYVTHQCDTAGAGLCSTGFSKNSAAIYRNVTITCSKSDSAF